MLAETTGSERSMHSVRRAWLTSSVSLMASAPVIHDQNQNLRGADFILR